MAEQLTECPVCDGPAVRWGTVTDRHYRNVGTWELDQCTRCAARYLNPMPTAEELGAFYPTDYYSFHVDAAPASAAKSGVKGKLRRAILPLGTKEPVLGNSGRMVDVGCGSGWMLDEYRAKGWSAVGVDYSPQACEAGRARGHEMHTGSLIDAGFADESFDYVRSNHSFEHMNNPHEVVAEMRRILRPGGTLFIGVPDTGGLMARLFKTNWYFLGAPVHTINYNAENLSHLLEQHGFVVATKRHNSNHGSTLGSVKSWWLGRSEQQGQLEGGVMANKALILLGYWTARLLDVVGQGDCLEITARRGASVG